MPIHDRVRRILRGKLNRLRDELWPPSGDESQEFGSDDARSATDVPPPRDETAATYLRVLELRPGATKEDIRGAYKRLCKRYHPDRFAADEEKARLANQLLTEINAAYRYLAKRR
jgi:DnaJ-domain-containing protein 1